MNCLRQEKDRRIEDSVIKGVRYPFKLKKKYMTTKLRI